MKIVAERSTLNTLIKQLEPFVARPTAVEVTAFESVLVQTEADASLVWTAQSEDRAVVISTDADAFTVEGSGRVLIPVHPLKTVIAAISRDDDDEITIEVLSKKRMKISANGASAELAVTPIVGDLVLPSVPKITSDASTVETTVEDFVTLYGVGGQSVRQTNDFPVLTAVHLELNDETLTALSADKRSTTYASSPARSVSGDDFAVLIQPKAVKEVLSLFAPDDKLSLSITSAGAGSQQQRLAHFVSGDGSIHAVTVGPYYDISTYPKDQLVGLIKGLLGGETHRLVVSKHELLGLFKAAEKISTLNRESKEIHMELDRKAVTVSLGGDNTFTDSTPVTEWTGPENVTVVVRWDAYSNHISSFPEDKDGLIHLALIERKGAISAMGSYTEASGFNPQAKDVALPEDYFCMVPVQEALVNAA